MTTAFSNRPGTTQAVRLTPLLITGLFRDLLTRHFAAAESMEDEALRSLVWTPTATTTKIVIEANTRWTPQLAGSRPSIIIKRNDHQRQKLSIGDREFVGAPQMVERYTAMWSGSHTLFALAQEAAMSEYIAFEAANQIDQFCPILRRAFRFHQLQVSAVGAPSKVKESHEHWAVPISVTYSYERPWTLASERPALRSVQLTTSTN